MMKTDEAWLARKPHSRRAWLDRHATGLNAYDRGRLLDRWRRQGRRCSYCGGACESVDHVVPLSRGGTNYEGNLTPCCLPCNSSKNALLLIEWRSGRGHQGTVTGRVWMFGARPEKARRVVEPLHLDPVRCVCCYAVFTPLRRRKLPLCGAVGCRKEYRSREIRDRYWISVGRPPLGIDRPTVWWLREHIREAA